MILLDTNVVSAVMAPRPSEFVLRWLDEQESSALYLCAVTVAEVTYGLEALPEGSRRSELTARFEDFVARGFEQRVLPFDVHCAHTYGALMARRKRLGRPMSVADGQIAAIARHHNLRLATRNVRDFENCELRVLNPFG